MRLLTGTDIQQAVNALVSQRGDVDVAVPYWGQDALKRTGIANKENGELRVICDLLSGACNPWPIATLIASGIPVRTLDRLHAKVWINGNDVILGSANASMAGLPMANDDLQRCRDEANVVMQSETLAQSLRTWFEERWDLAREIGDRDLRRARILWSQRRRSTQSKNSGVANEPVESGISDLWRSARTLRLVAYDEGNISRAAQRFHREEAASFYTDEEWTAAGGEPPFYEWEDGKPEWTEDEGTAILDFSRPDPSASFKFNGLWTVRPDPAVALAASTLTLLDRAFDYNGKRLTDQELQQIAKKIQAHLDEHDAEPDQFGSLVDPDFFELWNDERPAIRQRLIDDATEHAVELCRSGSFSQDITLVVFQICAEDPDWAFDYAKYVGADIFAKRNARKKEINPIIGQRIREAIGGVVPKAEKGKRQTDQARNELIGSYTVMDGFDPDVVGSDNNDE
jgi:hypothetical protein